MKAVWQRSNQLQKEISSEGSTEEREQELQRLKR
jgi:hypothetical protein